MTSCRPRAGSRGDPHEATFLREELAAIDRAAMPSLGSGDGGVSDPLDRASKRVLNAREGVAHAPAATLTLIRAGEWAAESAAHRRWAPNNKLLARNYFHAVAARQRQSRFIVSCSFTRCSKRTIASELIVRTIVRGCSSPRSDRQPLSGAPRSRYATVESPSSLLGKQWGDSGPIRRGSFRRVGGARFDSSSARNARPHQPATRRVLGTNS